MSVLPQHNTRLTTNNFGILVLHSSRDYTLNDTEIMCVTLSVLILQIMKHILYPDAET